MLVPFLSYFFGCFLLGTFMAIGFADRVDFSLILMNDVQCGRRVPFRNISSCLYSNQGNYLGLASENVVEIYSTVMYSSVHILKGHIGNVSIFNIY